MGMLRALEEDQNTDDCAFGSRINDNGTVSRSLAHHEVLGSSSNQERVSHSRSTGVGSLPNDKEARDSWHAIIAGVVRNNSDQLASNSDNATQHDVKIDDDQEEIFGEDDELLEDSNDIAEGSDATSDQ